jgi:hypothetical protein
MARPRSDPLLAEKSLSKKGNPWFRARDYLFVALSPEWRGSSWRLWVKSPDGGTRTLPADFASFGALQRGTVAFLAEMPSHTADPTATSV